MWKCENVKIPRTNVQLAVACLLVAASASCAFGGDDFAFAYRGTINGATIPERVDVQFALYDRAVGGSPLWSTTNSVMPSADGVFQCELAGEGLAAAQLQHPAQVLAGEELPGGAQQMGPDDPPVVVGLLEGLAGRPAGPHGHGPAHGLVVLGLHGPEPGHDLRRILELRGRELLAQKALGDGIHADRSPTASRSLNRRP